VDYRPSKPHGQAIARDRHFTLLADNDGVGFVHCDDGVLVVPLDDGGNVLLALERSVAFDREVLVLAGGPSNRASHSSRPPTVNFKKNLAGTPTSWSSSANSTHSSTSPRASSCSSPAS
jgi:hypothetical protein